MKSLLSILAVGLLLIGNAAAQTPQAEDKSKEETTEARQELEKQALAMLDEILDGAQLLKLPENRTFVYAISADLLWTSDEKRARIYFQMAMTDLSRAMKVISREDLQLSNAIWLMMSQREQILISAARRDPQLALDLLQSTRQAFSENSPMFARMMDQESSLEQRIVTEVAESDPKRALKMAQDSLSRGVSYEALSLLKKLQSKDVDAAKTFANEMINKLTSTQVKNGREPEFLVAQSLLKMLLQPETSTSTSQASQATTKAKPIVLDDQTLRELIDFVLTAALSVSAERSVLLNLQSLLSDLEKRVPERTAQLRRKLAENSEKADPNLKLMMQYQALMRDGKPEALIEAAAKAPPDMRSMLYQSAAARLMANGDLEGARKVVAEHMTGSYSESLLATIDQKLISRALENEKIEEARKLIDQITPAEARLTQLAGMATSIFAKGNRKMALQLLDETQQLVNRFPENKQEINAMLRVAMAYAIIDPERAYRILEPVIDQANNLLAAAAVLEKFGADQTLYKNNEFRMQASMNTGWGFTSKIGKELASLARFDFARTRALADRFQRDEARTMARLFIAQAILTNRPEKADKPAAMVASGN